MSVSAKSPPRRGASSGPLFYDKRARAIFYQCATFLVIAWMSWYLFSTTSHNLTVRGMSTGFGFITTSAGFDTDFKLINYVPSDTYGRVFAIGMLNTLFISWGAVIGATLIGTLMGIARLSKNWLVAKLASAYVELLRNTPLLIQIVYWYLGVFVLLPQAKQSADFFDLGIAFLNNRGLYLPSPHYGEGFWMTGLAMIAALAAVVKIRAWARARHDESGRTFPTFLVGLGILIALPGLVFLATGSPVTWEIPELARFNFEGGVRLPPSFLALAVALTIYHSAGMTETVRAGIMAVDKGQREAAYSVGLTHGQALRFVILPQALRAIVPPTISLWMTIVKNSSLGVAIGYPEVVSLFMQTSLNQSGYAIEIVALTMLFYMVVSLIISACLNVYNKKVQLTER